MPRREAVIRAAWERGNLVWMLRDVQRDVRSFLYTTEAAHAVGFMHRGAGKSYLACVLAVEQCLRGTHRNVKYIGPTAKMVRLIAGPHLARILESCPAYMRPRFSEADGCYKFPNGSGLYLAGAEGGGSDHLRGTDTHFAVFDEEGFATDPDYIVESVLAPRLALVDGKVLHISSPPRTPAHPFAARVRQAEKDGALFRLPLKDNKYIADEQKEKFAASLGGWSSIACRREYGCEIIMDEEFAVLPELLHAPLEPKETDYKGWTPVIMCGFKSYGATIGILAWCSPAGAVHVSHEFRLPFAYRGAFKERVAHFTELADATIPAFADIVDEDTSRGLDFLVPLPKHDLGRATWALRTTLGDGLLSVDPRCSDTLRHLHGAIWLKHGESFDSSGDGLQFDFCSALARVCLMFAGAKENKALIRKKEYGRRILGI